MSYNSHIKSPNSLITSPEDTRTGFISIALEKNRKAESFVEEAKNLEVIASRVKSSRELLNIVEIRDSLIAAAGISDKAKAHFNEEDKIEAITEFIERFLEPYKENFIDELVYRFLLTKGDALGGSMRNLVGKLGEKWFAESIIQTLSGPGRGFKCCFDSKGKIWEEFDGGLELENPIKGLHWTTNKKERVLMYNITVPLVKKNVDLCLLDCSPKDIDLRKKVSGHRKPEKYLALGELKGGIDPAGADEHWKTANSALERIRNAFARENHQPYTFFIGAAIESAMAGEIYRQLEDGTLANSANLTNKAQVEELCNWLTSI